jgi:hypothetical protein
MKKRRSDDKRRRLAAVRLAYALPDVATQLRDGLLAEGQNDLAAQIDDLRIMSLCQCGSEGCATFDTEIDPPRMRSDHDGGYDVEQVGVVLVAEGRIICVDIPYDPDLSRRLREIPGLREA